jgi:oxygen-independent coproporphyrinogen-3 oxidase
MSKLLKSLSLDKRIFFETEWTMEANPSSITFESLKEYRILGINRISMGVQAMNDELLLRLGRVHSSQKVLEALDAVFRAGYTNVSVDLLCGVPNQSVEELKRAMKVLTQFPITHLSCYLLTLPSSHRMFKELPDEEEQLKHLLTIDEFMVERGFEHYEISNFAKPGYQAQHNLNYWKGESYLGLGPSAHSYSAWNSRRFKNWNSLHRYHELLSGGSPPQEWEEFLTPDQLEIEKWMLALRLAEGFPKQWLMTPSQLRYAERLTQEGLLTPHPHKTQTLRLTPKGFALSDQIVKGFI